MTQSRPSAERPLGHGRSAVWTLPVVATQYQPAQPTPAMLAALKAQQDGRFLDALILLDEETRRGAATPELNLLRASFLLQGDQSAPAVDSLKPLLADPRHGANAWALTAMALLQQGQAGAALEAAQRANGVADGMLPRLALSYALQGEGRLAEARATMRDFNARGAGSAIALAREAELALTVDDPAARTLAARAQAADAGHPYVVAVGGLVALIDGDARAARAAFETVLRRDPRDAKALFGLGLAEVRLGNFESGQEKLLAANEADPGNALILTYLGRSQLNLDQAGAARASLRQAQQADPRDPVPWLYQAQLELKSNQPQAARASLDEAKSRLAYRAVYRGERLLKEDEALLQANLAEAQRQLGLETLAFETLANGLGPQSAARLRNQADVLQGQRFGESARRSLLLQSLFNDKPGNLPAALDVYGDGAGMTGASTPQRGFIGELSATQASYNNYDQLFSRRARLDVDVHAGSRNSAGGQVRAGIGSETLGIGVAHMQFSTDGFAPYENLDNRALHAVVQWRPGLATQLFLSRQNFDSDWGGVFYPAQPWAVSAMLADSSQVTRLGVSHRLAEDGSREIRALLSRQQTDQAVRSMAPYVGASSAHSAELQYRQSGSSHAAQWGAQQTRSDTVFTYDGGGSSAYTLTARHAYAAWQQRLNPAWQVEAILGWGGLDNLGADARTATRLKRWLPHLGAVYSPDAASHVRLAAWQGMGIPALGDATLAPVSLAGILLARPDDIVANGRLTRALALAFDRQLAADWLLTGEARRRKNDQPGVEYDYASEASRNIFHYFRVNDAKLTLQWQPRALPWLVSLAHEYERLRNDERIGGLDSLDAQRLRAQQLELRWFAAPQLTANLALSHNRVVGSQNATSTETWTTVFPEYRSRFNQVDASMNWRFGGDGGSLTAGVRNAADRRVEYVEIDKLNPRFSSGRLIYARMKLTW